MRLTSQTWTIALEALRANRLRAFLTMLGVIIGSACIVLVFTIALTGRQYVIAQIEGVGSNLVYAQLELNSDHPSELSDQLTVDDMDAAKLSIAGAAAVAGTRGIQENVLAGDEERSVSLVGVTEGFQTIRNLLVLQGRFFDTEDSTSRSKVCLITHDLATKVFPNEIPIGKSLRVGEVSYTVIGVFQERTATYGLSEIQQYTVIVPFPLMEYYTGDSGLDVLYVQAASPELVASVTAQLEALLRDRHPGRASYAVLNLSAILDAAQKIALALTVVLLLIGFIALLVSGIGIMNIMLVSVTERTREIGIRKAIGARRGEILSQFLLEASLISGFGAVIGILLALALPVVVRPLLPGNLRVPVPWESVVASFVVSCATGVLFGYLPASKAARLQPTEALRYE
ncbi:MAG: ABC transporter permease [Candidatus Acidiferrales bacterium]